MQAIGFIVIFIVGVLFNAVAVHASAAAHPNLIAFCLETTGIGNGVIYQAAIFSSGGLKMANRSQKSSTRLDRGVNKFYVIDSVRLTATYIGRTIAEACQSA